MISFPILAPVAPSLREKLQGTFTSARYGTFLAVSTNMSTPAMTLPVNNYDTDVSIFRQVLAK
jgi:hypothetical protein